MVYGASMPDVDDESWEQAWRSRDPAYDGRFFIGVRTTGIYCRCVCPVRLPFRRNIEFLPSAAVAELAGFRPCLRCRPEAAPFSPAWNGTRTTVERAARLIIEHGALDGGASMAAFADRLGVTARHLDRLFARHWGASPSAVARTARVQRAKRLLDETDLPMAEVALQAGFGSLRRFNAVFAEVYKRSPSEIRRRKRPDEQVTPKALPPVKGIDGFLGLLAGKTRKVATIDEIGEASAAGWAGQEQYLTCSKNDPY